MRGKSKYFFAILVFQNLFFYSQNCGVERWQVKTLSDVDTIKIDFKKIIPSSVHEQVLLARPEFKQERQNDETSLYSISCYIIGYKKEKGDKDIHVIISDIKTGETMVAEIPNTECSELRGTSRYNSFVDLNLWFEKNIGHASSRFHFPDKLIPVKLTGIGFWDFLHGQKGMAKNGREIHPVIGMEFLK